MTKVLNRDFARGHNVCGRLRTGAEKTSRGPGRPLTTWRVTSDSADLLNQVRVQYGGDEPTPWAAQVGDDLQVVTTSSILRVAVVGLQAEWRLWGSTLLRRCDGVDMFGEQGSGQCVCPLDVYEMRSLAAQGKSCRPSIGLRVILPLIGLVEARPWLLVSHNFDLAGDLDVLYEWIKDQTGAPPGVQVDMRTDRDHVPLAWLRLEKVQAQQPYWRPVLELYDLVPTDRLPAPDAELPPPAPTPEPAPAPRQQPPPRTGGGIDEQGAPPEEYEAASEGSGLATPPRPPKSMEEVAEDFGVDYDPDEEAPW